MILVSAYNTFAEHAMNSTDKTFLPAEELQGQLILFQIKMSADSLLTFSNAKIIFISIKKYIATLTVFASG